MRSILHRAAPLLLAAPLAVAAQTWDLAADFTGANTTGLGANGAWSYGWGSVENDAFRPDDCSPAAADPPLLGCSSAGHGVPGMDSLVVLNPTSGPVPFYGVAVLPAHTAGMRPDSEGRASIVRWTAPADGQYHITASIVMLGVTAFSEPELATVARSLDAGRLVDGGTLMSATLFGPGQGLSFDSVVQAEAGSMWNFIVGRSGAATTSDSLSAAIHISAVPELPSGGTLALGLAVLGIVRRRQARSRP